MLGRDAQQDEELGGGGLHAAGDDPFLAGEIAPVHLLHERAEALGDVGRVGTRAGTLFLFGGLVLVIGILVVVSGGVALSDGELPDFVEDAGFVERFKDFTPGLGEELGLG